VDVAQENIGVESRSNLLQQKYENTINNFLIAYLERNHEVTKNYLEDAGKLRHSLG